MSPSQPSQGRGGRVFSGEGLGEEEGELGVREGAVALDDAGHNVNELEGEDANWTVGGGEIIGSGRVIGYGPIIKRSRYGNSCFGPAVNRVGSDSFNGNRVWVL